MEQEISRRARVEPVYSLGGFKARIATAHAFHKNTMLISRRSPENPEKRNPFFGSAGNTVFVAVNLIFACETYLKAFVMASTKAIPEHHNLWKIFKVIPEEVRAIIQRQYLAEIAKRPNRQTLYFILSLEAEIPADEKIARVREAKAVSPKGDFDSLDRILKDTGESYHAWRYLSESTLYKGKEKILRLHYDHLDCLCIACDEILSRSIPKD